ncbi:hypothetical protein Ddye_028362 [Dipteronia dyeriana]|uniref:Uncharacterized protein n=1 Tax=Dipteronia dyeriana TaxID=168575 RepID=A0AAD9TQW1_9ROSI|nr:hypothetical protein Ddye_028362 [Dipteronia dyeriana]
MSLFRLPSKLVHELHRMSSQFWWDSTEEQRRLNWAPWHKLFRSKDCGGLGFIDLTIFIKALLAKHCWRIIHNPNTLAARGLKHCYFPETSLLKANCGSSSSFLWRRFMCGREIISQGSRWRIGDGTMVGIYSDRWIPRPSTFKVISPIRLGAMATVAELKLSSGA